MDVLTSLDNVVRFEAHIRRFMLMTDCDLSEAERVLSATGGARVYRRVLREHLASGGTLEELGLSGSGTKSVPDALTEEVFYFDLEH